ncbi:autotransporter adhesin [Actinobacillus equuli]|nr:autotransporter adhesin [Actinobacillus equuli]
MIWNEATQSWTAVSELAKGHVKSSSQSKVIDEVTNDYPTLNLSKALSVTGAVTILGGTLSLLTNSASAATASATEIIYTSQQGTAIAGGTATGSTQAIAIGGAEGDGAYNEAKSAKALGVGAVAIGAETSASGTTSVALAWNAVVNGENAAALGAGSRATGTGSVAVGGKANAGDSSTNRNTTAETAIGYNSSATISNSVAIGANSITQTPLLLERQLRINQPDVVLIWMMALREVILLQVIYKVA